MMAHLFGFYMLNDLEMLFYLYLFLLILSFFFQIKFYIKVGSSAYKSEIIKFAI
jgi:hypothetical protein